MNNPWKATAIAMALVVVTALLTGVVVANWTGRSELERKAEIPRTEPLKAAAVRMAVAPQSSAQATPPRSIVETCNRQATQQVGAPDKTTEVVKDAAIGAVLGAAVGAAGGAIADGGTGAGKGAAIGGLVGAGGGTLYGLNENRKNDEKYREVYARCMRSRGYSS
jgi:Glycine zipper